jgi:hypothetical protein
MKKSILLAASLLALNLTPVFGQPNPNGTLPPGPTYQQRLNAIVNQANGATAPTLTKFNLDFPGGTPKELVAAIEKAMGKPLNAIIPDETADTKIPALKMSNVDVPHLFNAVVNMSYKYAPRNFGGGGGGGFGSQPRDVVSSYGFETRDGDMSDDSIWYFFVYKAPTQQAPPPPQKICQFFSLSPYLDHGFTVDDITTAIQTGWKMAGVTPTPELNYHKETKLLIAFGEPKDLNTINNVLNTLPAQKAVQTQSELDSIKVELHMTERRVEELMKKVQVSKTDTTSEEKSGK